MYRSTLWLRCVWLSGVLLLLLGSSCDKKPMATLQDEEAQLPTVPPAMLRVQLQREGMSAHHGKGLHVYEGKVGDTVWLGLQQGSHSYALWHVLSPEDGWQGNQLAWFQVPAPAGFDSVHAYSLWGAVGAVQGDTAARVHPVFRYGHGMWRRGMEAVQEDQVFLLEAKGVKGRMVNTVLRSGGVLVAYVVHTVDGCHMQSLHMEEVNEKTWCADETGTPQWRAEIPLAEGDTYLEAGAEDTFYAWVRTAGRATELRLRTVLQTKEGGEQTLEHERVLSSLAEGCSVYHRLEVLAGRLYHRLVGNTAPHDEAWLSQWMGDFSASLPLGDLLIPAAHDAAANSGGIMARCQALDVDALLRGGVRCLDVRVKAEGDNLSIYHGIAKMQGTVVDRVIEPVVSFLREHPTETVLILYKDENNKGDEKYQTLSEATWGRYAHALYKPQGKALADIRLGDVRGKMVLITRNRIKGDADNWSFDATGWGDNEVNRKVTLHDYPHYGEGTLYLQDRYSKPSVAEKQTAVADMVEASATYYAEGAWIFNYMSYMAGGIYNVSKLAKEMNAWGVQYFTQREERARGVIFMDFACTSDDEQHGEALVRALLEHNYR